MRLLVSAVLFLTLSGSLGAYGAGPEVPACVSLEAAAEQDAKLAETYPMKVYQLNAIEIASFNAFLDNRFNDTVDIVTLFVFLDGHAEYAIGSKEQDIKCSMSDFFLAPSQTRELLRVVRGVNA